MFIEFVSGVRIQYEWINSKGTMFTTVIANHCSLTIIVHKKLHNLDRRVCEVLEYLLLRGLCSPRY